MEFYCGGACFQNKFFMGIKKNNKYSASMKKQVTLMNSLMSCIVKIESTASLKTIISVSRDNSGKSELKLFTKLIKVFIFPGLIFPLNNVMITRPFYIISC